MSDYSEICRQLRLKPCLCQPVNRTCIKCKAAEALEALQARVRELERTSSVLSKTERECHTLQDWRMRALDLEAQWSRCSQACARLQTERDALHTKLEAAQRDAARYRWLFGDADCGKTARVLGVYRRWNGQSDWDAAVDVAIAAGWDDAKIRAR